MKNYTGFYGLLILLPSAFCGWAQPVIVRQATYSHDTAAWQADSVRTRNTYNEAGLVVRTASKQYAGTSYDSLSLATHRYDAAGRDTASYYYSRLGAAWALQSKFATTYLGATNQQLTRASISYNASGGIASAYLATNSIDGYGRITRALQQQYNYFNGYQDLSATDYHYPGPGANVGYDTLTQTSAAHAGDPLLPYERVLYKWNNFSLKQDSSQIIQEYDARAHLWVSAGKYRRQWLGPIDRVEYYYYPLANGRLVLGSKSGFETHGLRTHIYSLDYDTATGRFDSARSAFQQMDAFGNELAFEDFRFATSRYRSYGEYYVYTFINGGPARSRDLLYRTNIDGIYTPAQRIDYELYLPTATREVLVGTLSISPNPATDEALVSLPQSAMPIDVLVLEDALGRTLAKLPVQGGRALVDLKGLPSGTYTVRGGPHCARFVKN